MFGELVAAIVLTSIVVGAFAYAKGRHDVECVVEDDRQRRLREKSWKYLDQLNKALKWVERRNALLDKTDRTPREYLSRLQKNIDEMRRRYDDACDQASAANNAFEESERDDDDELTEDAERAETAYEEADELATQIEDQLIQAEELLKPFSGIEVKIASARKLAREAEKWWDKHSSEIHYDDPKHAPEFDKLIEAMTFEIDRLEEKLQK